MLKSLLHLSISLLLLAPLAGAAQSVGIGTAAPNAKAALDISAADKGLLIPRLDSAQRAAISAPPDGLMVFQRDGRRGLWYAFGGQWLYIPDAARAQTQAASGLTRSGNTVRLGGLLTEPTTTLDVGFNTLRLRSQSATQVTGEGVDQMQNGGTGSLTPSGRIGQTFTVGATGVLTRVEAELSASATGSVLLELYRGSGYGGALVAAQTITVPLSFRTWASLPVTALPEVMPGEVFTLAVTPGTAPIAWYTANTNPYPGGQALVAVPTLDFNFRTFVGTRRTAELGLHDGQVRVSSLAGVGTRMVIADATGTLGQQAVPIDTDTDGQTLSLSGQSLSISGGNAVTLPDASSTNEIQTLSATTTAGVTTVSLSNGGGTATVPSSADNLGSHTATQAVQLNSNWLSNDGAAEGLRVDNNGRVGIGASAPDRPLTVQGTGTASQLLSLKDNAGTTQWHYNLANGGLNLAESGVADNRIFVQEGGNVGLGTATPATRLDVNGAATVRGTLTVPTLAPFAGVQLLTADDNGQVGQAAVWSAAATINGVSTATYDLTHNAGTSAAAFLTAIDQTGGGFGNYVIVSYSNTNTNTTRFFMRNTGASQAEITLRIYRVR